MTIESHAALPDASASSAEASPPSFDDIPLSRWGSADRVGAANLIPSTLNPALLALTGQGRVIDLSQPISTRSPRLAPGMSPFTMCMWTHPHDNVVYNEEHFGATNGMAFADERIEGDLHTGTHVDALGHAWVGDRTFNRLPMRQVVTSQGLRELGIENLPPIVTRGVVLDIPHLRGRALMPGEPITADDVMAAAALQGIGFRSGDIVLIHTGWAQYYDDGTDRFVGESPGVDVSAARYLAEQGAVVVGSDTMGLEVWPAQVPGEHFPVHVELLVNQGVYILEQADLRPLITAGISEFLCLCLTPLFVGATAAPVRLIAVA